MTTMNLAGTTASVTTTQSSATPSEIPVVSVTTTHTPLIGLVPTPGSMMAKKSMLLEEQH